MAVGGEDSGRSWRDPLGQDKEGCHDTDSAASGPGGRRESRVVEPAALAGDVPGGGLGLWLATVVVTFVTGNLNLVPTIILLGSFLVPVAFVSYAFGHADRVLTAQRSFTAVVSGGVLGGWGPRCWRPPCSASRRGRPMWGRADRGGGQAGRAVAGGPPPGSLHHASGPSLLNLVESEVLRGILTPVGHGLWTAILGGAVCRRPRGPVAAQLGRGWLVWAGGVAARAVGCLAGDRGAADVGGHR